MARQWMEFGGKCPLGGRVSYSSENSYIGPAVFKCPILEEQFAGIIRTPFGMTPRICFDFRSNSLTSCEPLSPGHSFVTTHQRPPSMLLLLTPLKQMRFVILGTLYGGGASSFCPSTDNNRIKVLCRYCQRKELRLRSDFVTIISTAFAEALGKA
ncbi:hypothetical protein Dimus_019320 [Dionaea muscipula]